MATVTTPRARRRHGQPTPAAWRSAGHGPTPVRTLAATQTAVEAELASLQALAAGLARLRATAACAGGTVAGARVAELAAIRNRLAAAALTRLCLSMELSARLGCSPEPTLGELAAASPAPHDAAFVDLRQRLELALAEAEALVDGVLALLDPSPQASAPSTDPPRGGGWSGPYPASALTLLLRAAVPTHTVAFALG